MIEPINPTLLFSILADATRLRILNLLSQSEVSVFDLIDVLREPQPKISRHLAALREIGLVETRRHGKKVFYRIARQQDENLNEVLRAAFLWLGQNAEMRGESEQVSRLNQCSIEIETSASEDVSVLANKSNRLRKNELDVFLL